MNRLLLFLIFLLFPTYSFSAEISGVSFPDKVQVDEATLELNGLGLRKATFLGIKVYAGALYLEQTTSDALSIIGSSQRKRIVLHFVRDVGKDKLTAAWSEGFKSNNDDISALVDRITKFKSYMNDIKSGQKMVFDFIPGKVVAKVANNSFEISGDDFAKALISVWLGKNPPNKDLKIGLLGQ